MPESEGAAAAAAALPELVSPTLSFAVVCEPPRFARNAETEGTLFLPIPPPGTWGDMEEEDDEEEEGPGGDTFFLLE